MFETRLMATLEGRVEKLLLCPPPGCLTLPSLHQTAWTPSIVWLLSQRDASYKGAHFSLSTKGLHAVSLSLSHNTPKRVHIKHLLFISIH